MIIVKNFNMFKTLLELIKESNISYKIIGNYIDSKPDIQVLDKEYENTHINFKFLVISSMLTFTYSGKIKYSSAIKNLQT